MVRKRIGVAAVAVALTACAAAAAAQEFSVSAKVDKTTVPVGSPVTLTLTLAGDVQDADLQPVTVPDAFAIVARSQSTNFALQAGAMQRSTSLSYILVARRVGRFKLGPFIINHHRKTYETEPVEITITEPERRKSAPSGERFVI